MSPNHEIEQKISTTVHRYCHAFDSGDFATFAGLFERGRWFMVPEAGSRAVDAWTRDHVILYDGRPRTRHQITNLVVDVDDTAHEAAFSCYVDIWMCLAGERPVLLAQARFYGTFRRHLDDWWWHEHVMEADHTGDLSRHIRDLPAAVAEAQASIG